jgi:hypothetical protein
VFGHEFTLPSAPGSHPGPCAISARDHRRSSGAVASPFVANHKKTKTPRKPQRHLPKVGTPADNAYRQRRSRQDVVDFGLGRRRNASPLTWIIAAVVIAALVLGVIGLVVFT